MWNEDYQARFGGIARLYGQEALQRFHASHVMVVGVGGVGSWAAESLARSGIGTLSLVDLDDLCLTNVNRQLHALSSSIGRSKVGVLADRFQEINPALRVIPHQRFYTESASPELLSSPQPDLVIDAIDSVRPKCHLLASCRSLSIPVLTSGGAGGRRDPSRIGISDLSESSGDALLRSTRKNLRSHHNFPSEKGKAGRFGIHAVYSTEQPHYPQCDGSAGPDRPEGLAGSIKCDAGFGAVTHVTATFANLLVGKALDILCQKIT